MPFEITIHYGESVAASGRIEPGESRLELALPRLPAREVEGRLELRAADEDPPTAASASCISEWLRCGEAALSVQTLIAPLTFSTGAILGSLDRPHESTLYLTFGARLLRLVLRIPTLLPAGETAPAPAAAGWEQPAAVGAAESYGLEPPPEPVVAAPPPAAPPPPTGPPPVRPAVPIPPSAVGNAAYGSTPAPPAYSPGPPAASQFPTPGAWGGAAAFGGAVCRNHPELPTARYCGACRNPFCDHCLVEFQGAQLCAWCKQATLAQMQRGVSRVDPRAVLMWARIYDFVVSAGAFVMLAWQGVTASQAMSTPLFASAGWLYALGLVAPVATLLMALPPAIGLAPGRRWAYAWQTFMLIPTMLLSCLWAYCFGLGFWVVAIILLIYWVKPEVRDYIEQPA